MNGEKLYLRKAKSEDVELLYEWINDEETRRNSFDSHIITHEEHCTWFNCMMTDPDQIQYILMLGTQPIGQVRLTVKKKDADIDYSICHSARGHGYGKMVICLIKEKVREDCPGIKKLIGRVKADNIPSCYCFSENGFKETKKQFEFMIGNKG